MEWCFFRTFFANGRFHRLLVFGIFSQSQKRIGRCFFTFFLRRLFFLFQKRMKRFPCILCCLGSAQYILHIGVFSLGCFWNIFFPTTSGNLTNTSFFVHWAQKLESKLRTRATIREKTMKVVKLSHWSLVSSGHYCGSDCHTRTKALLSKHLQNNLAERGFGPQTFGIWAQHVNHCATVLYSACWVFDYQRLSFLFFLFVVFKTVAQAIDQYVIVLLAIKHKKQT